MMDEIAIKDAINLKVALIMAQVFMHIPYEKVVTAVDPSADMDVIAMHHGVNVAGDLNIKSSVEASIKAADESEVT